METTHETSLAEDLALARADLRDMQRTVIALRSELERAEIQRHAETQQVESPRVLRRLQYLRDGAMNKSNRFSLKYVSAQCVWCKSSAKSIDRCRRRLNRLRQSLAALPRPCMNGYANTKSIAASEMASPAKSVIASRPWNARSRNYAWPTR